MPKTHYALADEDEPRTIYEYTPRAAATATPPHITSIDDDASPGPCREMKSMMPAIRGKERKPLQPEEDDSRASALADAERAAAGKRSARFAK